MKNAAILLGILVLGGLLLWKLMPDPGQEVIQQRTDLPWQISAHPDGSSTVIDLHLGETTLAQAMEKLGAYEELALFEGKDGGYSLEAWFGNVQFGPLKAKVTASLAIDAERAKALAGQAVERKASPTGDWKLLLPVSVNESLHDLVLTGITYIPGYSRLDEAFFRERLGEPVAWQRVDEERIRWFYPDKGLSLLIDDDGKDVFEYVLPRDFMLPEDAEQVQ